MSLWAFVCSVLLCKSVRKRRYPRYEVRPMRLAAEFFLSQGTQSSRSFVAHSFEPTEGLRHTEFTEAFQLRLAVTFCDIGWLNVSVECCVFCSSVFFCEKENAPSMWERTLEIRWGVPSLTKDIFFSHRTHRFNRTLLRTVLISQNAFGIQRTQGVSAIVDTDKEAKAAYIQPIGVSRWLLPFPSGEGKGEGPLSLWTFVCSVLLCFSVRNRKHPLDE